jgi:hypothetical protein
MHLNKYTLLLQNDITSVQGYYVPVGTFLLDRCESRKVYHKHNNTYYLKVLE